MGAKDGLTLRTVLLVVAAIVFAAYFAAPFVWLVRTSFMTEADTLAVPPQWIPDQFTLDNYLFFLSPNERPAFQEGTNAAERLPRAFANSVVIAAIVVLVNLVLGIPAAYSFVRFRFRGSGLLLMLYVGSRMVPSVALMVPIYVVFARLGLVDNILAPAVAHVTHTLPFTIWILKNYLQTIPQELEDAARVDRCSRLQAVTRVLLPVSVPGLLAASMFAFMSSWGEFLLSAILTRSAAAPITVVIANLATDENARRTLIASGTVIAVIPPMLLALLFQRHIVQGLVSGSVKA